MPNKHLITYLSTAENDLVEILDYLSAKSKPAAAKFLDNFDQSVARLEDFPKIGIIPKDERLQKLGYRILLVENYLVFYVIREQQIEIRRVIFGKREYSFLF